MLADQENYLHRCLCLHGQVAEIRYGKRQALAKVESHVQRMWAAAVPMWEIVEAIHDHDAFDASMCKLHPRLCSELHRSRRIRNAAIHNPASVAKADVEYLINVARKLQPLGKLNI